MSDLHVNEASIGCVKLAAQTRDSHNFTFEYVRVQFTYSAWDRHEIRVSSPGMKRARERERDE